MPDFDSAAYALAARQLGYLTHAQAVGLGFTLAMIRSRIGSGRWVRVQRGVYRMGGVAPTWEGRALAAALTTGEGLVSSLCAANLWDVDGFGSPGLIDVTVVHHRRSRRIPGVRVHESKAFHLADATVRKGVPCTGVARTILDVCAAVDHDFEALCALDCVLRRHIVTWDELWRCLILHAARGRNGIARYRRILVKRHGKRVPGMKIAAMALELLIDCGLPEPAAEVPVFGGKYKIDLAYPDLKIAIECLGKIGHLNDRSFEYDPARRNELLLDGWIVLEITWQRLIDQPEKVVAEVLAAIKLRSVGS
jgi:hypothetical protein